VRAHRDPDPLEHDLRVTADALRQVALFATLSAHELAIMARLVERVDAEPGQVVIRDGDLGREFLVVEAGTAEVTCDGAVVETLGPGDCFGEIALVENIHRTATVTATSQMKLIVLTAGRFRPLRHTVPQIYAAVKLEITRGRAARPEPPAPGTATSSQAGRSAAPR